MWALHVDRKAQAIFQRLHNAVQREAEIRGIERESKAKEELLKDWEWQQGAAEREAKAAAELEERKRKMEEERLERERKWQEERAARQQQASGLSQQPRPGVYSPNEQQPYGGYPKERWNE
jgi:hypothetical protein